MLVTVSKRQELLDCLNCTASHRVCDRARYRCNACSQNSDVCQGYPRRLRWLPGVASRGKDKNRSLSIQSSNPKWQPVDSGRGSFKFKPRKAQVRRRPASRIPKAHCAPSTDTQSFKSGEQISESQDQQRIDQFESSSGFIVEPYLNLEPPLEDTTGDFDEGLETIFDTCVASSFPRNDDGAIDLPLIPGAITWQQQESEVGDNENDDCDENVPASTTRAMVSISSSGQSLFLGLQSAELLVFCKYIPIPHNMAAAQADPFEMIRSFALSLSHMISQKIHFGVRKAFRQNRSTYCTPCSRFHCSM